MANKVFGVKNITHLLYGLIVLLPMFAILGRVIYTQSNPNAKDSYSQEFVQKIQEVTLPNSVTETFTYTINYYNNNGGATGAKIYYSDINIDWTQYGASTAYNYTRFYISNNTISLYEADTAPIQTLSNKWGTDIKSITFTSAQTQQVNQFNGKLFMTTITTEKLDNAFEYSLKSFTDDNNLGEVDMFSWFTDLFLDHSNAHNQIYIGFVNWYLNYTMLVSCGYLFFLVLIWFVNFVRKILDKSMYQDYGGF